MTHFQHGRKKARTELQPGDYEASVLDPRTRDASLRTSSTSRVALSQHELLRDGASSLEADALRYNNQQDNLYQGDGRILIADNNDVDANSREVNDAVANSDIVYGRELEVALV